jgi:hypothetical protein
MDTSEQYIEMCRKAVEVQRKATTHIGDVWHAPTYGIGVFIVWTECLGCQHSLRKACYFKENLGGKIILLEDMQEPCVWLPRQDQLQEMVVSLEHDKYPLWQYLINDFIYWWETNYLKKPESYSQGHPPSLERLWLAFVMKEKFNKTWNSTDWVKETHHAS